MYCNKAMLFKVVKLHKDAVIPERATLGSAGYDLCSVEDVTITPGARAIVPTGLAIGIGAFDVYARIAPRSGLAAKNGLDVMAGIVDSDYTGELKVVLINLGTETVVLHKGSKIAQLVFERIALPRLEEANALDSTTRGDGGFGSTG